MVPETALSSPVKGGPRQPAGPEVQVRQVMMALQVRWAMVAQAVMPMLTAAAAAAAAIMAAAAEKAAYPPTQVLAAAAAPLTLAV